MQLGIASAPLSTARPSFRLARAPSISRFSPHNSSSFHTRASTRTTTLTSHKPPSLSSSNDSSSLRTHLSNLDKLLHHNHPEPPTPRDSPGVLQGFNLAGIWPGSKQVEDMSPRNLNKLKRLLSRTNDYSPRNSLAARWADLHGRHDWAGLLDPLDENLRREIVRYGEFVQGAYHTFNSDPATPARSAPGDRFVSIPDRAFRVTRNLYATSSLQLPGWVQDRAPEWMTQRSSWVGYVAVCDSPREIARMGRRDIVIALRGTSTCLEWAENARANLVSVQDDNGLGLKDGVEPKVECGFWSLYKTRGAHVQSLSESIVEEVKRLMEQYKGEQLSITVTGHSLGAALAVLAADELSTCEAEGVPPIAVISFGGPRVGNRVFVDRVRDNGVKVLRVVNTRDVITRVPGLPVDDGSSAVADAWGYSHVGSELRLDSKASPFLKPDADVACCHDLEAYLHLVDGFVGSECPFRDNAKRPIWKLLNEQASNVKKLYTSKAKDLTLNLERVRMQPVGCLASPS